MKNTRERSLEVRKKAKEALNEITTKQDWEFREYYNDLYGRKNGYEVRRLKGTITNQHGNPTPSAQEWVRKEVWSKWKEEFEKIDFGSEFKVELHPVDKLRSIGGLAEKEMLKDRWVNGSLPVNVYFNGDSKPQGPMGTAEEYEDRFNNEDLFFTIRIIYKDELDAYCTKSGRRK